jgi:hypothetical protein
VALPGGAIRRPLKCEQFCTVFTLGIGLYSQGEGCSFNNAKRSFRVLVNVDHAPHM